MDSGDASPPLRRIGRPSRDAAQALRAKLLRRAIDEFLAKGFEGATIQGITEPLGMSKRTAFAWYGNKAALFQAAMQSALDEMLEPLQGIEALESDDLEATLRAIARVITTTLMSPAGQRLIRIANAEVYKLPEIGPAVYRHGHQRLTRFLGDLLRRRLFGGKGDFEDQASAFLNLLAEPALMRAWGYGDESFDIDRFIDTRVALFLKGVVATV